MLTKDEANRLEHIKGRYGKEEQRRGSSLDRRHPVEIASDITFLLQLVDKLAPEPKKYHTTASEVLRHSETINAEFNDRLEAATIDCIAEVVGAYFGAIMRKALTESAQKEMK